MTRNVYLLFSLLFLSPAILVNSKRTLITFVSAWRGKLSHLILVIMLLLFTSCSSQQFIELTDDCLITKGDIEYIPYAVGERCTVKWDNSTRTNVKYEVRLLYYVKGPNCQLLNKGQGAPTTVNSHEYSFDVEPGITIFSIRTVSAVASASKKVDGHTAMIGAMSEAKNHGR